MCRYAFVTVHIDVRWHNRYHECHLPLFETGTLLFTVVYVNLPETLFFHLPSPGGPYWDYRQCALLHLLFMWLQGSKFRSSGLHNKHSSTLPMSYIPSHHLKYLYDWRNSQLTGTTISLLLYLRECILEEKSIKVPKRLAFIPTLFNNKEFKCLNIKSPLSKIYTLENTIEFKVKKLLMEWIWKNKQKTSLYTYIWIYLCITIMIKEKRPWIWEAARTWKGLEGREGSDVIMF